MIPHNSRAIDMCEQAGLCAISRSSLCQQIIDTQREEIAQMERIIDRRS